MTKIEILFEDDLPEDVLHKTISYITEILDEKITDDWAGSAYYISMDKENLEESECL